MRRFMIVCLIPMLIGTVAFCGCTKRIHEERTTVYNQDGSRTDEKIRTRNEKVAHLLAALRWGVFRPTQTDIQSLLLIADELAQLGKSKEAEKARKWAQNLSNFLPSP